MKRFNRSLLICGFLLAATCVMAQNVLTKKEQKEGWKLLFDGKTTTGWRNFNSNTLGAGWKVQDGALYLDKSVTQGEERGDIMTH
jgi:hypothetical protein